MSEILTLIMALIVIVLVMYLSYIFSKFIGNKMNKVSKSNIIKVVDRVSLGQDKYIVLCEISGKYYLVGVSNQSVNILKEFDDDTIHLDQPKVYSGGKNFIELFNSVLKNKANSKPGDENDKT